MKKIQLSPLWVGAGLLKSLDIKPDFRGTRPYKVFVRQAYYL